MELLLKIFNKLIGWYVLYFLYILFSLKVTTTIGYGSPNKSNSYSVHGSALGAKEVDATRQNLGWPFEPFHVPEDVKQYVNQDYVSVCLSCYLSSFRIYKLSGFFLGTGAATSQLVLLLKPNGTPSLLSMRRSIVKRLQSSSLS